MNPKNTWLLTAVTVGLFVFVFYFERHWHKPPPPPQNLIPGLKPSEISAIEVEPAGQLEIRVERTNGGWRLTKPLSYPAQNTTIETFLRNVSQLEPRPHLSAQTLAGGRTVNEEYGFDNPQATLVFMQNGEPRQLKLGSFTAPGDQVYAQVVGMAGVDIIDADFLRKCVPQKVDDWRDTLFVSFPAEGFDKLTVGTGDQSFELQRDDGSDIWQMTKPVLTRADYPKINGLLQKLQNLQVTKFVLDDQHADLDSYGLQTPAIQLKFDRSTNRVLDLQFGKIPTDATNQIYARIGGQISVVELPRDGIASWQGGFQEFRDKRFLRFTNGLPDVIEVFAKEHFTLQRQSDGTWFLIEPDKFPADTNVMRRFIQALTTAEATPVNNQIAVTDTALDTDLTNYGLTMGAAHRYLLRDAKKSTSNTNSDHAAELDLGIGPDGKVYARRADRQQETSVYLANPADFKAFPSTVMGMRARRIWDFKMDDILSVTIRQNGVTEKSSRIGPAKWVGSAPIEEFKMEAGADELGSLEADAWVQRGDVDRAKFGFSDKSLEITVEVQEKNERQKFIVDFGGQSPRGLRYGDVHMPDGENWIFEVPPITLERLLTYFSIQENKAP